MVNFEEGLSVKDFKTRPLPMLRADTAMYAAKLILCCVNLVDASRPAHNQMAEQRIPCGCFSILYVIEGLYMHLSRIAFCSIVKCKSPGALTRCHSRFPSTSH